MSPEVSESALLLLLAKVLTEGAPDDAWRCRLGPKPACGACGPARNPLDRLLLLGCDSRFFQGLAEAGTEALNDMCGSWGRRRRVYYKKK